MTMFTILLAGELVATDSLKKQIIHTQIIAADGGIRHASKLQAIPSFWVGDFDSTSEDLRKKYHRVPQKTFPQDKDKTDGELAIDLALEMGATGLILCGAFGGQRWDHCLSHMTMALALTEKNIPTYLTSGLEEAHPLKIGLQSFNFPDHTPFSIVAFSTLQGLSIHGAKWPLTNAQIQFGSSLTVSNQTKGELVVSLQSGRALLLSKQIEDSSLLEN